MRGYQGVVAGPSGDVSSLGRPTALKDRMRLFGQLFVGFASRWQIVILSSKTFRSFYFRALAAHGLF
jgi:hypothetical protein